MAQGCIEELKGPKRCWRAQLVVVKDLSYIYDCEDERMLAHVLAISALGVPAVTLTSWNLAEGDPNKVPAESVIRHRPLAMEHKVTFQYSARFHAVSPNVGDILKEICAKILRFEKR